MAMVRSRRRLKPLPGKIDRKSTRLNSHSQISYAVFCLKKKTLDDDRFAAQRLADEDRDDQFITHAWAVGDAIAQDGEGLLIELPVVVNDHLSGDLARRVDVTCVGQVERLILREQSVAARARGDPDSAGEHDA